MKYFSKTKILKPKEVVDLVNVTDTFPSDGVILESLANINFARLSKITRKYYM